MQPLGYALGDMRARTGSARRDIDILPAILDDGLRPRTLLNRTTRAISVTLPG